MKQKNVTDAYDKYANMLYQLSLSHMQHREDAEDVIQEVFCKYYTKAPHFADEAHEKAWFIRVTQNNAINLLKRKGRKNISLDDICGFTYEKNIDSSDILKKVIALPEKYKSTVILYYYDDYSVDQISEILTISKSAVKMRLKRGREILKLELEDYV